uniref:Transporter n=1 Tax=Crassostrea virginica TaxID=6565 RepID=A0A8B8D905_CRAVI|nr:sodium- and chloride-dependent glycine transporter 1-like [Crassostrea virginica]
MGGERAEWSNPVEFILTCVGFAVGLGNVWRFPYLAFKNGGGAFLIPYFICLVIIGIPLFYLEISFGQFASLGPVKIWRINLLMKGLGYSMVIVSWGIALYYVVIISWCLYFFFASMTSYLPWQDCDNNWNSCLCQDGKQNFSLPDPWLGARNDCLTYEYPANTTGVSVSEEYFRRHVLEITDGFESTGGVKWDVTLCNLLAWTIIFIVLSKGIKTLGKVVYFTAIFPYILLTALLIRGLTLDGYKDGIDYYITPDLDKLTDAKVWSDAAVQIFYSLSACQGGLIAMASFNKFDNNVLRDTFLVPIINCLTSFYAGFVIFSVLGFMAYSSGSTVADVAKGGPGLVFIVYPEALAQMPAAPVWAILFFFMMANLGFSSAFSMVETVMTGLLDEFPSISQSKWRVLGFRFGICVLGFILGLPMTTRGGDYMLTLVDNAVSGFPLLFVGLLELIIIAYVYGFFRFKRDIEMMIGDKICVGVCFWYFGACWLLISPLALLAVIVFKIIQTEPFENDGYLYPDSGQVIFWLIQVTCLIPIPVWFVYYSCKKGLGKPKHEWGPALPENRIGRYASPFSDVTAANGSAPVNDYVTDMKDRPQDFVNGAYVADTGETAATKF